MTDLTKYKIRPAARLIKTIGKDLIRDRFAAVVELVKNAFDADSPSALVKLEYDAIIKQLTISVSDNGHGMTFKDVVDKWLVPATSDKLINHTSEKGRQYQGRKGIGRFAATALGDAIFLTTKSEGCKEVSLLIDMDDFSDDKYLEDIDLIIEESGNDSNNGTKIEIISKNISLDNLETNWGAPQREKLVSELRKLLAPNEISKIAHKLGYDNLQDDFSVFVQFIGFTNISDKIIELKPYNIIDLYDYRIHGQVNEHGNAIVEYYNQNIPDIPPKKIKKQIYLENPTTLKFPGKIQLDLRVFDRDPESIDELINRGLKDPISGDQVGKQEAKNILNKYYGVALFRGRFRIRPYGDSDFDWLNLDKERVQNPAFKIGHNQVIGFINIQPEEISHLVEKSARDGLVENPYYDGLIRVILEVMRVLEGERFEFRQKSFRGRRKRAIDKKLDTLLDHKTATRKIIKKLNEFNISDSNKRSLTKIINDEFEKDKDKKSKDLKELRDTIALYQGQATLGKITTVVLHEGRKHIKVLNEIPPNLAKWSITLSNKFNKEMFSKLCDRSELLVKSSKSLSLLFKRIEPLAITKKPLKKELVLLDEVNSCFLIFEGDIKKYDIVVSVNIVDTIKVLSTSFDIMTVFANLIDNSLYWMNLSGNKKKGIRVEAENTDNGLEIIYSDSGPGFQGSNLDLMFEPGYSMKPEGTGLGLALAGEAISRMNGEIRAVRTKIGACFIIEINSGKSI